MPESELTYLLQEKHSKKITLKDDPIFVNAIDCMISYFYAASYDVTKYDTSEALLHAQVAVMADKYACGSLFKLAQAQFGEAIKTAETEDWVLAATVVYEHTTSEASSHMELRELVAAAAAGWTEAKLRAEIVLEILRSNAHLATDVALATFKAPVQFDIVMRCAYCKFSHFGSDKCPNTPSIYRYGWTCPSCKQSNDLNRFAGGKYEPCGHCPGKISEAPPK